MQSSGWSRAPDEGESSSQVLQLAIDVQQPSALPSRTPRLLSSSDRPHRILSQLRSASRTQLKNEWRQRQKERRRKFVYSPSGPRAARASGIDRQKFCPEARHEARHHQIETEWCWFDPNSYRITRSLILSRARSID